MPDHYVMDVVRDWEPDDADTNIVELDSHADTYVTRKNTVALSLTGHKVSVSVFSPGLNMKLCWISQLEWLQDPTTVNRMKAPIC